MARVEAVSLQASVPVKIDMHLTVDDSNFDDVGAFHRQFDLPAVSAGGGAAAPSLADAFDEDLWQFRLKFLREELRETNDAWKAGDLAGVADGLIDLVYVALGTAHLLGLPWQELWDEVQRANMSKVRASTTNMGPRKNAEFDVIKGPDFVPPDVAGILERHGFTLTWEVE